MRIERKKWISIEFIVRRYPEKKKEYEEYIKNGCHGTKEDNKAINAYVKRIKEEIRAVETVYSNLNEEEQKLIKGCYWTEPYQNTTDMRMMQNSYSERWRQRIIHKIIYRVGEELGEIKSCKIATSQQ